MDIFDCIRLSKPKLEDQKISLVYLRIILFFIIRSIFFTNQKQHFCLRSFLILVFLMVESTLFLSFSRQKNHPSL